MLSIFLKKKTIVHTEYNMPQKTSRRTKNQFRTFYQRTRRFTLIRSHYFRSHPAYHGNVSIFLQRKREFLRGRYRPLSLSGEERRTATEQWPMDATTTGPNYLFKFSGRIPRREQRSVGRVMDSLVSPGVVIFSFPFGDSPVIGDDAKFAPRLSTVFNGINISCLFLR